MLDLNFVNGKGNLYSEVFIALVLGTVGVLCFYSSIDGNFVFDDIEAIVNNRDLKLSTPISELFRNDFWGTYLLNESSHKSYRPLTVLSFRIHVWLNNGTLNPRHFHIFNLLLHGTATALLYPISRKILGCNFLSLLSVLLFTVHPVHAEAVAGLVGRADLLSAIFAFLCFLVYCEAVKCVSISSTILFTVISSGLAGVAMFCKEQGITMIGICCVYDILLVNRMSPMEILSYFYTLRRCHVIEAGSKESSRKKSNFSFFLIVRKHKLAIVRLSVMFISASLLLFFRYWLMNFSPPTFRHVDNPHSFAKTAVERALNYSYIYALNAWLLICPEWLCYDWSMGCVPLINLQHLFYDPRILVVVVFWIVFALLVLSNLRNSSREVLFVLLCIMIPFSVASNLLFRVGFVIAERILYLPSIGYCMLISIGIQRLASVTPFQFIVKVSVILLILTNAMRCHHRSLDWRTEKQLFTEGLRVCPLNAKIHYNIAKSINDTSVAIKHYRQAIKLFPDYEQAMNNLANILRENKNFSESEFLLKKALSIRPDFAAAWMNLGIVLASMGRFEEALTSYNQALKYRKNYPDCHYNLGNLFLSQKMHKEAQAAWTQATILKPSHSLSWNNMIVMLDSLGELDKAESLAREALEILPNDAALHFNLGNTFGKKGLYVEAEIHFQKALRLNENQPLYHTNLGVLYHRWKKYDKAVEEYEKALKLDPNIQNVVKNLNTVKRLMKT